MANANGACLQCKGEFERRTSWQRFCSWKCRNAFHGRLRTELRRKLSKAVVVGLFGFGCAHQTNLREVQEYDAAVRMAERRGIATSEMYAHLGMLIRSYTAHPAPDPAIVAQENMARAQAALASGVMLQAVASSPAPMPMSPMEYQRAVRGK